MSLSGRHEEPIRNPRFNPRVFDTYYVVARRMRSCIETIIAKYVSTGEEKKLLDYGCGDIPYKLLFEPFVSDYIGCDIGDNPNATIHINLDSRVPLPDKTMDIILSVQVLEHVVNVDTYLGEAYRLLKQEGILILSTHGSWTYHPCPHDLRRWTLEGLTLDLTLHRFRVVESFWILGMVAYSSQLRLHYFKELLKNGGIIANILLGIISSIYQISIGFGDRIIPDHIAKNNAAVYFIVAKKR
jgi:SAM-dependent methyltransferase